MYTNSARTLYTLAVVCISLVLGLPLVGIAGLSVCRRSATEIDSTDVRHCYVLLPNSHRSTGQLELILHAPGRLCFLQVLLGFRQHNTIVQVGDVWYNPLGAESSPYCLLGGPECGTWQLSMGHQGLHRNIAHCQAVACLLRSHSGVVAKG